MNYFSNTKYISNSNLTDLKKALFIISDISGLQKAYDFGSLFDAMTTEPDKLNEKTRTLKDGEKELTFTEEDYATAKLMKCALDADPGLSAIFNRALKQHEVYRERFRVEWEGEELVIPARIKFDGFIRFILGIDLKTTAATSQREFENSILTLDYDRQGAWYMDVGQVDRFLIIGVSKRANRFGKYQIFKYAIQRGDHAYCRGKAKYSFLAWKYYHYIYSLNTTI